MNKIYLSENYVIVERTGKSPMQFSTTAKYGETLDSFRIEDLLGNEIFIGFNSALSYFNEAGDTAYSVVTLRAFLRQNTGFSTASGGSGATSSIQGYYGLLSGFYFGGDATETVITIDDVNDWIDVELDINGAGLFDNRPQAMIDAQPIGHEGDGTDGNPIIFKLEGLDTRAFCNFRASMAFEPDEDEGQLESRLLFNRHTGASPIDDFPIEEVSLSMQNGADKDYVSEPMLSFFIGDTIDTNGAGDAGKCRFQIKSNVAGTLKLRALTWYINK